MNFSIFSNYTVVQGKWKRSNDTEDPMIRLILDDVTLDFDKILY